MAVFEKIDDMWGDASYYNWFNFKRLTWRTVQLAISFEALTLALANLATHGDSHIGAAALGLLIMIPIFEKERVERRGTGPTGRQYLSTLFLGRRFMGYSCGFWEWKKTVDEAADAYFPPWDGRVEKYRSGVCTWPEYVMYMANINDLGLGNDKEATYIAMHKANTM